MSSYSKLIYYLLCCVLLNVIWLVSIWSNWYTPRFRLPCTVGTWKSRELRSTWGFLQGHTKHLLELSHTANITLYLKCNFSSSVRFQYCCLLSCLFLWNPGSISEKSDFWNCFLEIKNQLKKNNTNGFGSYTPDYQEKKNCQLNFFQKIPTLWKVIRIPFLHLVLLKSPWCPL